MAVDIYNAFQQGREVGRRNAAYNALRTHYGDIAGDPEAAGQLQQYEQRQALFPLQTEAARLSNAANQARLPFIEREAEADIAAKQGLAAYRGEQTSLYAPKAEADIAAKAAKTAYDQARTAGYPEELALKHAQAVQAQETARLRGVQADTAPDVAQANIAALNALTGQRQTQTELAPGLAEALRGQREAQARAAEATAARGVQARYQVVQGPDGQIYRVPVTQAGSPERVTLDGQPVQGYQAPNAVRRAEQADERLRLQAPAGQQAVAAGRALGKVEGERKAEALPLSEPEAAKQVAGFEAAMQSFDIADKAISDAIGNTSALTAGPLSALPNFANPYAAELRSQLATLASKVVLDTVEELKKLSATGGTGFGALSDTEGERIKSRMGPIEQAATPSALKKALGDLQTQLDATRARADRLFKKNFQTRGQEAPAPELTPETQRKLLRLPGDEALLKKYGL